MVVLPLVATLLVADPDSARRLTVSPLTTSPPAAPESVREAAQPAVASVTTARSVRMRMIAAIASAVPARARRPILPTVARMLLVVAMAALGAGGRSLAAGAGGPGGGGAGGPVATIALAPVGDVDPATLAALAPGVAERFGARVVIAPPLALPRPAWDAARRQWRTGPINDALARARRPGWERLVGVADADLYAPPLHFVFGEADPRGVAVFSLARLHDPDRARFIRRATVEAVHELGHTYGLGHCRDPRCVMWFSNTLAETDAKSDRFCAAHAAELARALARIR